MTDPRRWTRAIAALAMVLAGPASAEWRVLMADEIGPLLTTHDIVYEAGWERHEANGRLLTRSTEGPVARTGLGEWMLRGDARCLRWNRAMGWECYRVETEGEDAIRFTDTWRNVSTGRLVPREDP